jgi:rare lipoprotein A
MDTSDAGSTGTKEYFSEAEYGVKASPRVALNDRSRLDRTSGRDHVGKPYKVKGKWYYPKVDPGYDKKGLASWYGSAFNGRLTANGEIYNMNYLTAAHPTMPLPSYARVTNLENGSSVIVRVNDRGPFEKNRVIDLSKRAANMLGYKDNGVAKVRVQYVGRAPLNANDESYLVASYEPGPGQPGIPGIQPSVMVAMAGATVDRKDTQVPFPAGGKATYGATPVSLGTFDDGDPVLPAIGPVLPNRPGLDIALTDGKPSIALLGYADMRVRSASAAFSTLLKDPASQLTPEKIRQAWDRLPNANRGTSIFIGTYTSSEEARWIADSIQGLGEVSVEKEPTAHAAIYTVSMHGITGDEANSILRSVWTAGASDAFIVHE